MPGTPRGTTVTLGFGEVSRIDGDHVTRTADPFCVLCQRSFVSQTLFDSHLNSFSHKESLKRAFQSSHNIIDPNVGSVDGRWVPVDVEVRAGVRAVLPIIVALELACRLLNRRRDPSKVDHGASGAAGS